MPAPPVDEKAALLASLTAQRRHVLGILEGLDDDSLLRPVLPSGWNATELVHHLTVDVERFWFGAVVAADPDEISAAGDPEGGWRVPAGTLPGAVLDQYRAQAERSDEFLGSADLSSPPAWWPVDLFGTWRLDCVRQVVLHVLVETACHAGHLDAARELMDGRQWMVLDG